jgi:glycosyltransferase involved in cell wall biosynthesis
VIFVANRGYALSSSRMALINRFLSHGWQVIIASADDEESRKIKDIGATIEPILFNRGGLSPIADLTSYFRLRAIYKKWRPNLIHHFHAKPVLMGSMAARRILGQRVKVVNTITGLGHAFTSGGLMARLIGYGYKLAIPNSDMTIFQNRDDYALFLHQGWVSEKRAQIIAGSGVDISRFNTEACSRHDKELPIVVMLARLLKQKGIPEFVEIAHRLRRRWPRARFILAGEEEADHPDAVSIKWLSEQEDIEFLGKISDVVPLLAMADLFLFPSYYREGVPRVVLEASAMGLPTVGFNVPGVREAVRDGVTGYLVAGRDVDEMTNRVAEMLGDESLRLRMGRAARELSEASFDTTIYRDL